jgi:ketosteroid isomerase-like protein
MRPPHAARRLLASSAILVGLIATGCRLDSAARPVADAERAAIADTLRALLTNAYDLKRPEALPRMIALYADTGRLVSASGGGVFATRDSVLQGVRDFWRYVGQNMKDPDWKWGPMIVDVLSRDAAVVTTTYEVPHRTPDGRPHVVAGAWTAVFARRGGKWGIVQEHLSEPQVAARRDSTAMPRDSAAAGEHRH